MVWGFFKIIIIFCVLILNARLNDLTVFIVLSEMYYVLDFYCIKLNPLKDRREAQQTVLCVSSHSQK